MHTDSQSPLIENHNADLALVQTLARRADGRLTVKKPGESAETAVVIVRCFPWTRATEFISIRDDKGKEVVLIEALESLEPAQRQLVEAELAQRDFLSDITRIDSVSDEMELFHWKVMTTSGERTFLTNRHDYPRNLPGGMVLIKDVCGDQYLIKDPAKLDVKSRKLLWVYLD
jgi:hypothetical protein